MKYAVEVGSGTMTYVPSFIKTGSGIQKLVGKCTDIRREHGDHISLLKKADGGLRDHVTVCVFAYISLLSLLGNGSVNTFPSQRIHTEQQNTFALRSVSIKASRRLVSGTNKLWSWVSTGPKTKNDYAGEDQQQFIGPGSGQFMPEHLDFEMKSDPFPCGQSGIRSVTQGMRDYKAVLPSPTKQNLPPQFHTPS
jgi:hypothetical protein